MRSSQNLDEKHNISGLKRINIGPKSNQTEIAKLDSKKITTKSLIEILLHVRPSKKENQSQQKNSSVSIIGNMIIAFLNPKAAAAFAVALPRTFQPNLRTAEIWGLTAYNAMPQASFNFDVRYRYEDAKRITTVEMKYQVALNCMSAIASSLVAPVAGGFAGAFGCITFNCCVLPCQLVRCSENRWNGDESPCWRLEMDAKQFAELAGCTFNLLFNIPCIKVSLQTTACLIAYAAGSVKDHCGNEFNRRISIFDNNRKVLSSAKNAVVAPAMTRL